MGRPGTSEGGAGGRGAGTTRGATGAYTLATDTAQFGNLGTPGMKSSIYLAPLRASGQQSGGQTIGASGSRRRHHWIKHPDGFLLTRGRAGSRE